MRLASFLAAILLAPQFTHAQSSSITSNARVPEQGETSGVLANEVLAPTNSPLLTLEEMGRSNGGRNDLQPHQSPNKTIHLREIQGVDPTGTVDSAPAIGAALRSFGNTGGVLDVSGGRWLVDSANLNIPTGVSLVGSFSGWKGSSAVANGRLGTVGGTDFRTTIGSVIILNPAYTITLGSSSGLRDVQIIRKGLVYQLNEAGNFRGTAITAVGKNYATDNLGNDLIGVQIIGFERALDSNYMSRWHIERVSIDCTNGIRIRNSGDVTTISHVHMWPYATNGVGVSNAQNHRDGKGLELANLNDIPQFNDIFIEDWQVGVDASGGGISVPNWSDITVNGTNQNGSICFDLGSQNAGDLSGLMCYDSQTGIRIRDTSNSPLTIRAFRYVNGAHVGTAVSLVQGTVSMVGGSLDGMQYGILVENSAKAILRTEGVLFDNATSNYISAGSNSIVLGADTNFYYKNMGVGGWANPTISVLNNGSLVLPVNGDVFEVTALGSAGGIYNFNTSLGSSRSGRRITLIFLSSSPPAVHSAPWNSGKGQIHLKNGTTFQPVSGGVLNLVYSGSSDMWFEESRSE